jgi:hypothetical protein
MRLLALVLVTAVACGSSEPAESPIETRTHDLALKMIDMALRVKTAIEQSLGNCDKAAANLEVLAADAKIVRDEVTKLGLDAKIDKAVRTAWEKEGPVLQAGIKVALESIKPALDRCAANPAFQRAKQHAGFLFAKHL